MCSSTDKKKVYFYGDGNNANEVYTYFHPRNVVKFAELDQFQERKQFKTERNLMAWCESVKNLTGKIVDTLREMGYERTVLKNIKYSPSPSEKLKQQRERWLPYLHLTATSGSSMGWHSRLGIPDNFPDTKACVVYFLTNNAVENPSLLYDQLDASYEYLKKEGNCRIPVKIILKDEVMKTSKLMDGRSRSIGMPDWTAVVVEAAISSYVKDNVLYGLDYLLPSLGRFSAKPIGHWALGVDLLDHLARVPGPVIDLDVTGWDKSMEMSVIVELYLGLCSNSTIATNLAHGYNGRGVYLVGNELVTLTAPNAAAWCSGSPKTLSGNSIMHSALLHLIKLDGVVQGDDANIFVLGTSESSPPSLFKPLHALESCPTCEGYNHSLPDSFSFLAPGSVTEGTAARVERDYGLFGLKCKQAVLQTEPNFCKLQVVEGTPQIDFVSILRKAKATMGQGDDINLALESFKQMAKRTGQVLPMHELE